MENRVFAYHKNSNQIHLENIISRSTDGTCIIFNFHSNSPKEIGTLRAIKLMEQDGNWTQLSDSEKEAYNQQLSILRNHAETIVKGTMTHAHIKHEFLSPIFLGNEILQKETKQLKPIEYIFPQITYAFFDWKENGKFGTDLYIYQKEVLGMEIISDNTKNTNNVNPNTVKPSNKNIVHSDIVFSTSPLQIQNPKEMQANTTTTTAKQPTSKRTTGTLKRVTLTSNTVLDTTIAKDSVKQVIFSDTLKNLPGNAWDVSEEQNKSIMAWIQNGILHICGDGKIVANPHSDYLFAKYKNLSSIDFGNCFDTRNVVNMYFMFYECPSLTKLDLSTFRTSNVTDMGGMFWNCTKLKELNLDNFDTTNVKKMSWMFYRCLSLTQLNLSHFCMTNVKEQTNMFGGCNSILVEKSGLKKSKLF